MTALAPHLTAYLRERLPLQKVRRVLSIPTKLVKCNRLGAILQP